MISPPRASRSVLATLLLLAGLGVTGCGGSTEQAAPPASARPTQTPSTTPATPSTDSSDASTADAEPTSPHAQLIKVEKYGISFELPKSWITLDAKNVLRDGADRPMIKELAARLGASPDQLVKAFSSAVQTMSVSTSGAVRGFVDNVNTVGQEGDLDDDQVKLQLATIGAKPGAVTHTGSGAGDVIRVPYTLRTKAGPAIRAVALAVRTGTATVVVTISSAAAARAAAIADQVESSLARLPGGGSGL